jgi:hypothetical protein
MSKELLKTTGSSEYTIQYTGKQLDDAIGKILGLLVSSSNDSVTITLGGQTFSVVKKSTFDIKTQEIQNSITTVDGKVTTLNTQVGNLSTNKQDKLVSGSTIKTINGASILGAGDMSLETG